HQRCPPPCHRRLRRPLPLDRRRRSQPRPGHQLALALVSHPRQLPHPFRQAGCRPRPPQQPDRFPLDHGPCHRHLIPRPLPSLPRRLRPLPHSLPPQSRLRLRRPPPPVDPPRRHHGPHLRPRRPPQTPGHLPRSHPHPHRDLPPPPRLADERLLRRRPPRLR